MKQRTFEQTRVFSIIARLIVELYEQHPRYVTTHEIALRMLDDGKARAILDEARQHQKKNWSLEHTAINMVAFFSARITLGTSDWGRAFDRTRKDNQWAYKPIGTVDEDNDDLNYTVRDYARAFRQIKPAPHHKRMLQAHYHAPGRTLTATQMSRAMGYRNYRAANVHNGTLGKRIAHVLHYRQRREVDLWMLVTFTRPHSEWHWTMRPQVAKALEQLGWTGDDAAPLPEEIVVTGDIYEGAVQKVKVNKYERSGQARAECILHHGCKCSVCGQLLADIYGEVAQGFTHVHHFRPLARTNREYRVDPVRDLCPICPNCHAIMHLKSPPYTIGQVRNFMKAKR